MPAFPVVTSGEAVAAVRERDQPGPGPGRPLARRGARRSTVSRRSTSSSCPDGRRVDGVDAVVVGSTDRWDRSRIGMVADAVRRGLGSSRPTRCTPSRAAGRSAPDCSRATERWSPRWPSPRAAAREVAGKPHRAMAALICVAPRRRRCGRGRSSRRPMAGSPALGAAVRAGAERGHPGRRPCPVDLAAWRVAADLLALVDDGGRAGLCRRGRSVG